MNSLIVGNAAELDGSGILQEPNTVVKGINLLVAGNLADVSGTWLSSINFSGFSPAQNAEGEAHFFNSIIWNGTGGISTTDQTSLEFTHCDMEEIHPGRGNISMNPQFVSSTSNPIFTRHWTMDSEYSSETSQSILTDASAEWQPGEFVGRRMTINPDIAQPLHFVIAGNSENTISVWGNATEIAKSGDDYQIFDFHLLPNSPCIDSGSNDLFGLPGSANWSLGDVDHHLRAWDGDGDGVPTVDMGPYEFNSSSLVGDLDGDSKSDKWDLFQATQRWRRFETLAPLQGDQNGDNRFDQNDLVILRHVWDQEHQ